MTDQVDEAAVRLRNTVIAFNVAFAPTPGTDIFVAGDRSLCSRRA